LSETSPSASCNPTTSTQFTGTIGVPLPSTDMKLLDDEGQEVTELGQPGEIAIKGPQVMAGYWQRPDETARCMTADGYFKSGDIGIRDARGYFKIVDRKKDMILVSGFNVYPNEIEEVMSLCPGVLECAAVGVPDEKTGEAVKLVVVKKVPGLTEADVREHGRANLTAYKQPKVIEFKTELPKTAVGKILRRELRDAAVLAVDGRIEAVGPRAEVDDNVVVRRRLAAVLFAVDRSHRAVLPSELEAPGLSLRHPSPHEPCPGAG
jgi:long-chain acyl-CoA synthetase